MTVGLMIFDYVDRQVIVSLFPHLKAEWSLSDKQLGALVSIVSITVALGGIPVALFADRVSRVKSIVAMAGAWSLATISCMFARGYGALFAARAVVGLGEAGYGSVGAGLIASHFPARMRGTLMAGFFASASVGSVLGVMLGGVIADHWGWKAAFGVVGIPGLVLALLYLFVRDYKTVELTPRLEAARQSAGSVARHIVHVLDALAHDAVGVHRRAGAADRRLGGVVLAAELPRPHPGHDAAGGRHQGRAGRAGGRRRQRRLGRGGRPRRRAAARGAKLRTVAALCLVTLVVICFAFGAPQLGIALSGNAQFALIVLGGLLMTCTVGPASAAVIDVTHPGVRSTGASVLSLFQNLFGLALGPFVAGALSDSIGLEAALTITPLFGLIAVVCFARAATTYQVDKARSAEPAGCAEAVPPTGPALA